MPPQRIWVTDPSDPSRRMWVTDPRNRFGRYAAERPSGERFDFPRSRREASDVANVALAMGFGLLAVGTMIRALLRLPLGRY
ncbi:MAG: hypothetical protein FJ318_09225 [SAR202 cluster bacterium]|nr:hypothetical protein [SAR202 cluster bacterium]